MENAVIKWKAQMLLQLSFHGDAHHKCKSNMKYATSYNNREVNSKSNFTYHLLKAGMNSDASWILNSFSNRTLAYIVSQFLRNDW